MFLHQSQRNVGGRRLIERDAVPVGRADRTERDSLHRIGNVDHVTFAVMAARRQHVLDVAGVVMRPAESDARLVIRAAAVG